MLQTRSFKTNPIVFHTVKMLMMTETVTRATSMHTVYPYSKRTRKKSNGKKLFCQATDFSFNKKSFKIYNNTL